MRTIHLVVPLLLLAPMVPMAAALAECGATITFVGGSPQTASPGTVHLTAVFRDDPLHCGVDSWSFRFLRNGVFFSNWPGLGGWTLQGDNYVLEADAILDTAAWTVQVSLTEECCIVPGSVAASGSGAWTINVGSFSGSACSDGLDNDNDGRTDYPADAGCSSSSDNSELPECPEAAPEVQFCSSTGGTVIDEDLVLVEDGTTHTVVGYLDAYKFGGDGLPTVRVPCVTLLVDGIPVNPCATAGGEFDGREGTLVNEQVTDVTPGGSPVTRLHVCEAEYSFLVAGFGVESAQAYALC